MGRVQVQKLQEEKAAAEASLLIMASQMDLQRGAAAAEAGDVNDLKQFWQVPPSLGRPRKIGSAASIPLSLWYKRTDMNTNCSFPCTPHSRCHQCRIVVNNRV